MLTYISMIWPVVVFVWPISKSSSSMTVNILYDISAYLTL